MSKSSKSFVEVSLESHFPIQNLPWGVCRRVDRPDPRICVAIGELILDLQELDEADLLVECDLVPSGALRSGRLNELMAAGGAAWRQLRSRLTRLLSDDEPTLRDDSALRARALVPQTAVEMLLPAAIGDYTDFYSSREHAANVGTMLRGADNALMPNWLHLPVAYHGRASSIVPSGTDIHRPMGQVLPKGKGASVPVFQATRLLDFELEMGFFVGPGNGLGEPIPIESATDHIFGLVLVNDWSARDIQTWEYQPLGPFLAKNFATSIAPWVVSLEALEPFRTAGPVQDPEPLSYLRQSPGKQTYDIRLEVSIQPPGAAEASTLCRSNYRYLYWSMAQQLAHHTVNGCNLRPGDMMASGTISGPDPKSYGSMLELAWRGTKTIELSGGESRTFLQDGDRLTMTGWCEGDGHRVGFGEVTGVVLPTRTSETAVLA